jgi:hypothetical protein
MAPYTEYPRASYLVHTSGTGLRFTLQTGSEDPVHGSTGSLSRLEGNPGITSAMHTSRFRNQHGLQCPRVGTRYPTRLSGLISVGPPKCCGKNVRQVRTRLKPRWLEERKIYYTSRPAPWISPKMAPALQLKTMGFLCLRMPKQASGKDKTRRGS